MAKEPQTKQPQRQATKVNMVANPVPADEIFVDGFAGVMARNGVVKFDLYRVIRADPEAQTEDRQISHRLVLPQAVLPELAGLLQQVLRAAQQQQAAAQAAAAGAATSIVSSDSDPVQ